MLDEIGDSMGLSEGKASFDLWALRASDGSMLEDARPTPQELATIDPDDDFPHSPANYTNVEVRERLVTISEVVSEHEPVWVIFGPEVVLDNGLEIDYPTIAATSLSVGEQVVVYRSDTAGVIGVDRLERPDGTVLYDPLKALGTGQRPSYSAD
jgi:hypothetical protein